jgi:D-beta-D-heptose 7-phosphate kinase/D-beta-D-heptose 1-phosphate adenosyltransferase
VLSALSAVDGVVIFDEETPLALIEMLRPDVLVKGGDYTPEQVVGREVVEREGGRVVIVPLVAGHSSSRIAASLR